MQARKTVNSSKKPVSRDTRLVKIRTESRLLGSLKTAMLLLVIMLQFVALAVINLFLVSAWGYIVFSVIMTLLTCIYVLSSNKTGQSKAVWVLFLVIFFFFGYIVYFISDERFIFAFKKKRYKAAYGRTKQYEKNYELPKTLSKPVQADCRYLCGAGNFAAHTGNSVKYFSSGAQFFDDVLLELEKAEKFIFIEFFIISDGILLKRTLDILYAKAKAGVDVRIIRDGFGSHGTLSNKVRKQIKAGGIKLLTFNKIFPYFNVAQSYRDHRKIISIDGKAAYTGGINLADEYVNEKRMYGYWKDCGIKVSGSAVDSCTLQFLRQWEYLTRKEEDYSRFFNNYRVYENESVVVPYADGIEFEGHICKTVYSNIIAGANEKLYIMTPYFIPDETIVEQLVAKAQSGVDVKLIIPDIPDKKFAYFLTRNNAEKLVKSGIKLFCMKESFVHSKLMLSENCAAVSSANMDMRSFYQQFEFGIYTNDKNALADIESDFTNTVSESFQVTNENMSRKNLLRRIICGALQIFAPLM